MSASGPDPVDPFSASGGGGMPFDVTALLQSARKFFWVPLVLAPIGLVVAFIYAKTTTPVYRSSAELRLEKPMAPAASLSGVTMDNSMSSEDLNTILKTFINPTTAKMVVEKLHLTEKPYFLDNGRRNASEGEIVGYLLGNTKASIVAGTKLLLVSVDFHDPNMSMELANAMAEEGIAWDSDQRAAALRLNVKYLEDEVKQLESNLTESEKKLTDYMRDLGIISIDQDLNIESDKLRDLNMRSIEAHAKRVQLESSFKEIQDFRKDPNALLGIESIRSAPGVATLINRVDDLKGNLARLSKRYRPGNPFMIQAETELAEVEASLRRQVLDVALGIEASLAVARSNEAGISAEKEKQEQKVIKISEESIPSNVLRRQVETDRLAYEAALKKRNEELSQTRSQLVTMQISAPAGPGYMVSLSTSKMVLIGAFGGFCLGLGIIFLIAQFDKSLKTVEAAEKALKLPVLAAVPRYEPPVENDHLSLLDYPTMEDRYSAAAEAFRTLRVALDPPDSEQEYASILMVGSVHGEGTSFCSINLAVVMGQSGQRTLLVDANLRRPILEERIFKSSGHYGLTDYLVGNAAFSGIIRTTAAENVDVVTAGTPNAHPVELLSRARFAEFLVEARSLYDRVIFDGAPLTEVSDTLGFAHHCEVSCLIARAGKINPAVGSRAVELLERAGVRPTGVVLNDVVSLFPIKRKEKAEPREAVYSSDGFEFPVYCPSCNRSYESPEQFVQRTAPPGDGWTTAEQGLNHQNKRMVRRCVCNALIILPPTKRRDSSSSGMQRRDAFADLLAILLKSGMDRDEARTKLLLTVKVWRTELNGEARRENSDASRQRRKLFDEVLAHLVKGGLSEDEARTRLLNTIKIWQNAP